jgi:hypothetical protein
MRAFGVLTLIGFVVGVALIAALLVLRPRQAAEPGVSKASPSGPVASQIPSATAATSAVSMTLPADSYDLAYDRARGLLWLAIMQISAPDWLYAIRADGGFERWSLPDVQHNGYLSQIEVDSHGAVWVTEAYLFGSVRPRDGTGQQPCSGRRSA